jgi:hypothetical protein
MTCVILLAIGMENKAIIARVDNVAASFDDVRYLCSEESSSSKVYTKLGIWPNHT